MASNDAQQRRSLKYIRLAAYLAGQAPHVSRITMSFPEIETVVGEHLPSGARFRSWWRNDDRRMHSRAWLTAGWEVEDMVSESEVVFVRRAGASSA